MKATGIVRRIDDLGRVVIPKEIRRTMRIREGDPLEIFTSNDGDVIFKKYSPIGELAHLAAQYAEVMAKGTVLPVVICDRDGCVAASGVSKREVLERRLTVQLEEMMEQRQNYVLTPTHEKRLMPLEGVERQAAVAIPIIAAGDVVGTVCMLAAESGAVPNETDVKMAQVAAAFLGRQMEE
ncbi:MAG: AbrB/MazE/SpoVT family DNA-binding domain-containing protein [Clostridia bacterium]|nr:AbrB/MazE/SpoVT family DNA-binding domain-containing protein [Clostridia bacterium]